MQAFAWRGRGTVPGRPEPRRRKLVLKGNPDPARVEDTMTAWAMAALLAAATMTSGASVPEVPDRRAIFEVPAELRAELNAQVVRRTRVPERRMNLLVEFMFSPTGMGLEYDLQTTRGVEETWRLRRGNCLSFTIAFVALARAAGLDAYPQEVDQVLIWYQQADSVIHSGHVNAGVNIHGQRYTVDFDRSVIATRHRPRAIDDRRLLAHFYNNRGAELMSQGDTSGARRFLDAAIAQDGAFPSAWNNLGVLHVRNGDADAAERAYLQSLAHDPEYSPTLTNLTSLYQAGGRQDRLAEYQQRLEQVRQRDPFHNFILGLKHEGQGEYDLAADYFQRAVRLHEGEHRFHFGLARVYYHLGDLRRAGRALERALALSRDGSHSIYQRKLDSLRE